MAEPGDATAPQGLEEHRRSFIGFERLVLFSMLHVALTLACLGLAFPGDVPILAFLVWIVGTLAMVAFVVIRGIGSWESSGG